MKLFRKRLIPEECIPLDDDEVLFADDKIIVTAWKTIRPKYAFNHGFSCYFMDEGYKVSEFLRPDDSLLYWYCDIIDYEHDEESDAFIFRDLLADVIVYPDGFVKVIDLDEFEEALEKELLTSPDVRKAIRSLSRLLDLIYDHKFDILTNEITKRIQ